MMEAFATALCIGATVLLLGAYFFLRRHLSAYAREDPQNVSDEYMVPEILFREMRRDMMRDARWVGVAAAAAVAAMAVSLMV